MVIITYDLEIGHFKKWLAWCYPVDSGFVAQFGVVNIELDICAFPLGMVCFSFCFPIGKYGYYMCEREGQSLA